MVKRLVTFRASSIGDALMGKYFLENVHTMFPEATCFMLVGSRGAMIRELLAGYTWLTVLEANRRMPRSLLAAWRALRGSDLALTQYSEKPFSTPSKLFARLVSKRLIGFEDSWWGNKFLYDTLVPWKGEVQSGGMILEEQKALRVANIHTSVSELTLSYTPDHAFLPRIALGKNEYVVAHLFSGSEGRSVSQVKRADIVRALAEAIPYTIVLTGGEADAPRAAEAARGLKNVINLTGKTSILEFIALIANSRRVLSLDTGGAHIAAHLKKPLVVLARKEARIAWWGRAMYNNRPVVLCNESANDDAPRLTPYPPSMETIDTLHIKSAVTYAL